MSAVVIAGDTSGSVTLNAPAVAGSTTLNLPTLSGGTLVTSDSSGNVGIGTTSPTNKLSVIGGADFKSDSAYFPQVSLFGASSTSGSGPYYILARSKGTYTTPTTISNGDFLGTIQFQGYDGTSYSAGAQIYSASDNTVSTGNVRAALSFSTGNNTEQMRITSAGLLQFNSGYGSIATAYGCRAWVNFNGTGTVAIRASGNVSSITDNGTGDYTVNFTTAMPDVNYSVGGSIRNSTDGSAVNRDNTTHGLHVKGNTSPTTGAVAIRTTMGATDVSAGAYIDYWQVNVNINR